jgi:hypothetical protein
VEKRLSVLLRWCLRCTTTSQLLCTLWMKLMLHLTSKTYLSLQITSRRKQGAYCLHPWCVLCCIFQQSVLHAHLLGCCRNAQFVVISLRNNMFELADLLMGIYKTDNCTKSITINPDSYVPGKLPTEARPLLQQQRAR